MEEVKEIYNSLNKENQAIVDLVAKGMQIAQNEKGVVTIEKAETNN